MGIPARRRRSLRPPPPPRSPPSFESGTSIGARRRQAAVSASTMTSGSGGEGRGRGAWSRRRTWGRSRGRARRTSRCRTWGSASESEWAPGRRSRGTSVSGSASQSVRVTGWRYCWGVRRRWRRRGGRSGGRSRRRVCPGDRLGVDVEVAAAVGEEVGPRRPGRARCTRGDQAGRGHGTERQCLQSSPGERTHRRDRATTARTPTLALVLRLSELVGGRRGFRGLLGLHLRLDAQVRPASPAAAAGTSSRRREASCLPGPAPS